MTAISDGLSNIYSLTSRINALKNPNNPDPDAVLLNLEQSFNEMLNNLMSTADQDKENDKYDPFASFSDYQTSLNNFNKQASQNGTAATPSPENSLKINSYTGSLDNIF